MTYSFPSAAHRVRALSRRLTLIIAAGALALTAVSATARPARADTEDLLRFLAGAIVIGAIVHAIDDNSRPRYQGQRVLPDDCLEVFRIRGQQVQSYNAQCLRHAGYSGLPEYCYRDFGWHGRNRGGYVADCLYDAGYRRQGHGHPPAGWDDDRFVPPIGGPIAPPRVQPGHGARARLPGQCAMHYRQSGHRVEGFWSNCLHQAGFTDLPRHCRVESTGGDRIYTAQCLYDAGYRRPR